MKVMALSSDWHFVYVGHGAICHVCYNNGHSLPLNMVNELFMNIAMHMVLEHEMVLFMKGS